MSNVPLPMTPSALAPADNSELAKTISSVTLSWAAVEGPGTYALRCQDLTEPTLRHAGNNCQNVEHYLCINNLTRTSFALSVKPGHRYLWWVHKVNQGAWSLPALASFAVGPADAAEFVEQMIPEIMAPGLATEVSVTVRNNGTTTWNGAAGFHLGSQNPRDNMIWGANRIVMEPAAVVHPGETYTFKWSVTAPQISGLYNFQWRMVHAGIGWFGSVTNNRVVSVRERVAGGMWATRNLATGQLFSAAREQIVLRGGHYHLFEMKSQGQRRLSYQTGGAVIAQNYGACYPCPPALAVGDAALPASNLINWGGETLPQPWHDLFEEVLTTNGINLLRVFLFNGFPIKDGGPFELPNELYPFATGPLIPQPPNPGPRIPPYPKWTIRWKVREAVENDLWNEAYFLRLRKFAKYANLKNVFLQLSLFNYYELNEDVNNPDHYASPWRQSFWNPFRCTSLDWGRENLVNPADNIQAKRQLFFVSPENSGLRTTQEKIVRRVVKELAGLPNIIFEVMNEPHQGSHEESAKFASAVTGWIIDEAKKSTSGWRPLISVNASLRPITSSGTCPADEFDVDWWAQSTVVPNYQDVDIISYHGLTGYPAKEIGISCECANPLRHKRAERPKFPPVDFKSISNRYGCFKSRHAGKALMLSTDAVGVQDYNHVYGLYDMNLRDGQITTAFGNDVGTDDDKRTRSDLENWAYWCFSVAKADGGVIHFQNHSTFEAPYTAINRAFLDIDARR